MVRPRVVCTPAEQRFYEERSQEQRLECDRRRRAAHSPSREKERARDAARRRRRRAVDAGHNEGARLFDERWHKAVDALTRCFSGEEIVARFRACSTCKDALVKVNVLGFSSTKGYVHSALPPHLRKLNTVEERLIAPRLPFIHSRTAIADDTVIEVSIKRRLLSKPTYKRELVKKSNVKAWLAFLHDTPLYRHYRVSVDYERLDAIPATTMTEKTKATKRRKPR
ncbi:hypothetical protein HPB49_010104 [Dermacentor silvarum]|uniref:Uncharacterized protein n=1 Tax=Dermacentor silvarum TaxID=543639 RepID=A0ACB8C2X1_DERSI|nr:hypothetical protein HPB49_010104 [Dermacentor silvarum]